MKETLRLAFRDFWDGFDPDRFFLVRVLRERWDVVADPDAPLLVYAPFGDSHLRHRGTKVFYSGEPQPLPRDGWDFATSWHRTADPRHLRLPGAFHARLMLDDDARLDGRSFDAWNARPHFCNFVYSNPAPPERRELFRLLSERRFVHAPGSVERNTEPFGERLARSWREEKLAYLEQFRFTIAFENTRLDWYASEKVSDALVAGTIPIYWGNARIGEDLDASTLVDAEDFGSLAELADHVLALDDDRERARACFAARPWPRGFVAEQAAALVAFFERVVEDVPRRRLRKAARPLANSAAWRLRQLRR